jgi:hypothetical protein
MAAALVIVATGTSANVAPAAVTDFHVGDKCIARHNAAYRAHGFTCIKGRLRRVRKVRLIVADASVTEGNSGATTLSVPVTLSAASKSVVVVDYVTTDGSAIAGSDYATARGTLTFRPGEKAKAIPITVLGDTSIEPNEAFSVILSKPTNATIARGTATATIANDDTAVPVGVGSYQGATGNGNSVFFTVTANRTITGFRVNALDSPCSPQGFRIAGAVDFGTSVFFPVSSDGRITAVSTWSGSDIVGDVEWTTTNWKITGFFDSPTIVSGTILFTGELNYKGTHYRCSSGDVRWSATRQS